MRPGTDEIGTVLGSYRAESYLADCGIWHRIDCVPYGWIKHCSWSARQALITSNEAHTGVRESPTSDLGERCSNHRIVIRCILEFDISEVVLPRQLNLVGFGQKLRSLDHAIHGRNSADVWVERVRQSVKSLSSAK